MGSGGKPDVGVDAPVAPILSTTRPHRRGGQVLVWAAFGLGMIHAGFSAYWALGGTWLLPTVGAWAVDLTRSAPTTAALLLAAIAVFKTAGAAIPVLVHHERIPGRRFWRAASWVGGTLLVVYGAANVVIGGAVLAGIAGEGDYDADAMIGHVYLWDPLFALWGAALVSWLWLTRDGKRTVAG